MKNILACLMSLFLFAHVTVLGAYAETTDIQPTERSLTQLLTGSQDAGGLVPAIDPERLPEELPSVEGLPVLVQFTFDCWEFASIDQLDEAVQKYANTSYINYVVLDEEPVDLLDHRDGSTYLISSFDPIPNYLLDIADQSATQSFCGEIYTIENMFSLQVRKNDFHRSEIGAIVYYFTNGGVFVRYHDIVNGENREYTLQDFQKKARSYCEFLDHYQKHIYAYEQDHGPTVGNCAPDFLTFMQDPEAAYERYNYHTIPWTEKFPWAVPGICCVAVVILAPVTFLVVHNIRKKREQAVE